MDSTVTELLVVTTWKVDKKTVNPPIDIALLVQVPKEPGENVAITAFVETACESLIVKYFA